MGDADGGKLGWGTDCVVKKACWQKNDNSVTSCSQRGLSSLDMTIFL